MNSITYILTFVLLTGVGTLLWSTSGLIRLFQSGKKKSYKSTHPGLAVHKKDVAVIIAAYNESLIIENTLKNLKRRINLQQVYVVSDASTDKTVGIAKKTGVHVLALRKNRGKAAALVAGIKRFNLIKNYKVILILDADTQLSSDYFKTGLPLFNSENVVAVAGSAQTADDCNAGSPVGKFLLAYRQRVYVIFQVLVKYGQAAKNLNAVMIVPGFASMYRSHALKSINIAAPGFIIEDYNMTFDVHAKKLGRVAFHPKKAVAYTQDPSILKDYVRQTYRWTLGFWQTSLKHTVRWDAFGLATILHIIEAIITNVVVLACIVVFVVLGYLAIIGVPNSASILQHFLFFIITICLYDYLVTIIASVYLKQYKYLLFGIFFPLMRLVELWTSIKVFKSLILRVPTNGRWVSPLRRPNTSIQ